MVILSSRHSGRLFYGSFGRFRASIGRLSIGVLLPLAWVLLPVGCVGPRAFQPEVDPNTLSDDGFQAYLSEAPLVTVEEAYRAMLILADGEDTSETFEERRTKLEARRFAKAAWRLEPGNVIDAGSVAYMVCRICQVRGGVNYNLFARIGLGDRRYAMRELVYLDMLEDSIDYQYMTGPALVALMANADELMEKKGLYETERIDLSDETDRDAEGNLIVPGPIEPPDPAPDEPGGAGP